MKPPVLVAVPVKAFGVAKARLGPELDESARSRLGKAIAVRTLWAARAGGGDPAIVTGDDAVAAWASTRRVAVIHQRGDGLDGAAATVATAAADAGRPWIVLHADLPLVAPDDVASLIEALAGSSHVLAPTHDSGTSGIGGQRPGFPFAYGRGSFGRHRAAAPEAAVVVSPGLAHDLDTTLDLAVVRKAGAAGWIDPIVAGEAPRPVIAPAAAGDWRSVRDLRLRGLADAPDSFRGTYADESAAPDDRWAEFVDRCAVEKDSDTLVATIEGTACGLAFVGNRDGSASLGGMWVDPAFRRRGAGRALLAAGLDWARHLGLPRMRLAVTKGNLAAERMYEEAGFVDTGEQTPLRDGAAVSVHWMERGVPPSAER